MIYTSVILALLFTSVSPTGYTYQDSVTFSTLASADSVTNNGDTYLTYNRITFNGSLSYNNINDYSFTGTDITYEVSIYKWNTSFDRYDYNTSYSLTYNFTSEDNEDIITTLSGLELFTNFDNQYINIIFFGPNQTTIILNQYNFGGSFDNQSGTLATLNTSYILSTITTRINSVVNPSASQSEITTAYNNGYTDGFNEGFSSDSTAITIFNGILNIALVPINFFLGMFNFEILGINISSFVSALLSVCLVIIVIRFISGKKQGD